MKKLILFIVIFMLITSIVVFAEQSDYYVKTIPIVKVYDYTMGYRVVYIKGDYNLGNIYLPKKWFKATTLTEKKPKAELVFGLDHSYPYFSVFWEKGKFSHIRLYLNSNIMHASWGSRELLEGLTEKFNVETFELKLE